MNGNQLAIYWDFENIHISVGKLQGITTTNYQPEKKIADLNAIITKLQKLGQISINRAYGNWQWMGAYKGELLTLSFDLIQLFPPGLHAKNGADIRLALESVDDAQRFPGITHFIIIGGDSDYIAAAQKLRALGKIVIGIGTHASTNKYWSQACNHFYYYEDLVPATVTSKPTAKEKPAAKLKKQVPKKIDTTIQGKSASASASASAQLLLKAVSRMLQSSDQDYVSLSQLRPMMVKIDKNFSLKSLGYATMKKFIQAHPAVVRMVAKGGAHHVYLVKKVTQLVPSSTTTPAITRSALLKLVTNTMDQRQIKRLSVVTLHKLARETLAPGVDFDSTSLVHMLAEMPELHATRAYVMLSEAGSQHVPTAHQPAPPNPLAEQKCLGSTFMNSLRKQGIHWPPAVKRIKLLTAIIEYGQEHEFCYRSPRSQLTKSIVEQWNSRNDQQILTKTGINQVLTIALRSTAFSVKSSSDSDWVWTLNTDLRNPDGLGKHLEMYLLYCGGQRDHHCSVEEWSIFLYQDEGRIEEVNGLRTLMVLGDYLSIFDPEQTERP